MKSPEYEKWKTKPNSLLWLHGMTGCGKTVLSSTIIEDLNGHCQAHGSHTLLYFYFESNGTFEQHSTSFLRSLLLQLSRHNEAGMLKLRKLYFDCDRGRKQPTRDALYITLGTLFQGFAATYILLDALDECKDRSEPLHFIQAIHDWQLDNIHSLVTSRCEADIKEILGPIARADQIVELAPSSINDDISKYIQHSLSTDRNLSRWRRKPHIQEKIRQNLLDKGDGLFCWVDCQLVVLHDCVNLPMLEKALASLPPTIGATYKLILSSINEKSKQAASRAFQWLVLSVEPLTVEAFVDILALEVNAEPKFDPDWRMPDPEDILRVCSSLITITSPEQGHNRYVKLAHSSIKDYLLSDTILDGRASEYAIDCSLSHSHIAKACLCYLSSVLNNVETTSSNGRDMQSIKITYPLAEYAARYWTDHLGFAGAVGETLCSSMIELFQPAAFMIWSDIWIQTRFKPPLPKYTDANDIIVASRLTFATEHSLSCLVEHLLKHGMDPDTRDCWRMTALQVAAEKRHLKIAEILLEYGADPNAPALGNGKRALCWAAQNGHDNSVNALLDHGADINVIPWMTDGANHNESLSCDGCRGQSRIESPTWQGRSPLSVACESGHLSTVQLLISKGADVNIEWGTGGSTPLFVASSRGHTDVVNWLIAHGARPDSHVRANSALHIAAIRNYRKIAKALIEAGASVHAPDGHEMTPLHRACCFGRESVAGLLLDSGAHVNAISKDGATPLSSAAYTANASLIKLLIERGASENGDEDLIRFLIEYGSKISQTKQSDNASSQNTGLQVQSKVLKFLIDAGPDLDVPEDALTDALERALHAGHASLARKLLAKGANQDVDPRYTVQLEEVLNGKNMLTDMEPESTKPE
ncbi:MAG: hypothetical protein Q9176_004121 [Flavoplaca citrina]